MVKDIKYTIDRQTPNKNNIKSSNEDCKKIVPFITYDTNINKNPYFSNNNKEKVYSKVFH